MAVYKEEDVLTKNQVCSVCGKEKLIKNFIYRYYQPTNSYYTISQCSNCLYLAKRKRYEDRNEDYTARQRHKEVYTIAGRALLIRNRCKQRGKRDNIFFDLSKQVIIDKLLNGKCEVTGINLYFGELTIHPYAPSIDRINPNFGYTDNNIRIVCMMYNFCKNEFSEEQVKDFIYKAYKNLNQKYYPDIVDLEINRV